MAQHDLKQYLQRALADARPGPLAVAFSGGMDSSALLHALAQLPAARARDLRAVHIDHGLHADSATWERHCREQAAHLDVPFASVRVDVRTDAGHGLEDAARAARYAALEQALQPGEILALAHHRDDQAETILLKLLRGAGPHGLSGMRALRQCGKGYLWRPLLELPRAALTAYAQAQSLAWVEDPSNADLRLARNFLRAEILPRLRAHWPDAPAALAHSATWARQSADLIDREAQRALAALRGLDPTTLAWRAWLELPDAVRDPVLRAWLRDLELDAPAHFHVAELERQLRDAAPDRLPCVSWERTELRRYRDLLYAMRKPRPLPIEWRCVWDGRALALPGGGELALRDAHDREIGAQALEVRLREGGEKLKPAGRRHTRDVRLLLQEAGLPPWIRSRVPLIFAAGRLIAVADVWLSEEARTLCERLAARIVWRDAEIPRATD